MDDQISARTTLIAEDGKPVMLPKGESIADVEFAREGQDLLLQSPDGHAVRIEGYFDHLPDIQSDTGAQLSPQLVESFLPPAHPNEYAEAKEQTSNDASPIGKITQMTGEVTITRGGEKITAQVGTEIHQGDIVQTSQDGGCNILFSDNTTFAISHSAKLAIDQYVYNGESHEGSSFFSMLQGMFVYTSGLIGKEDPGKVGINTPVGSIGIRGTVVAGNIMPQGEESTITVVDGSVVITNAGGTLQMGDAFDTATLTSYATAPADSGTMATATFTSTFSTLAPVASQTFDGIANGTYQPAPSNTPDAPAPAPTPAPDGSTDGTQALPPPTGTDGMAPPPPTGTAPMPGTAPLPGTDGAMQPPPPAGTAPMPGSDGTLPPPPDGTQVMPPPPPPPEGSMLQPPPPPPPPAGTEFTGTTQSGFGTTTGTSTFTAPPPTTSGGVTSGGTTAAPPPPPPPTTTTGAPPPVVNFIFDQKYLSFTGPATPGFGDDGVNITWAPGSVIGHIDVQNLPTGIATGIRITGFDGAGNFMVRTLEYDASTTGVVLDTRPTPLPGTTYAAMHFNPATGDITLVDPFTTMPGVNGNSFNFRIEVFDTTNPTNVVAHRDVVIQFNTPHGAGAIAQIGDAGGALPSTTPTATNDVFTLHSMDTPGVPDVLYGRDGNDELYADDAGAINDVMLGGAGNDFMSVVNDGFLFIDGGTGTDSLHLAKFGSPYTYNFLGDKNIKNIEEIMLKNLGTPGSGGPSLYIGLQDVFDMTEAGGIHRLTIVSDNAGVDLSNVQVFLQGWTITSGPGSGTTVAASGQVTINASLNAQTVTLVIETGTAGSDTISAHVN